MYTLIDPKNLAAVLSALALATGGCAAPRGLPAGTRIARRAAAFEALHRRPRPAPRPGKRRWDGPLTEGATPRAEGVRFVLRSPHATRVALEVFGPHAEVAAAEAARQLGVPRAVYTLEPAGDLWVADVPGLAAGEVYGYRVWGPNWPYDPAWRPGAEVGFLADVDADGNRFCPNKLLIDPVAKSLTRDPYWDGPIHASGPVSRSVDTAAAQGKAVVVDDAFDWGPRPKGRRMLKDSVIYETHVRGMTKRFPDLPDAGTYKAMAHPAVIAYLKDLGVTAVELLPVHETANDANDEDPTGTKGDNYWGYMTLSYFAPDRRYAADQSGDGPVREFKAMVKALHAAGIEVILDVVYNHHAEGGAWNKPTGGADPDTATILSLRGVDNALYYQLADDGRFFYDNTGIGANIQTANPKVQEFLLASMKYWTETMGVDGFRFDLCSVLGNSRTRGGFSFAKTGGFLDRIAKAYGYTSNDPAANAGRVKLIAEPWAIFDDTYQVGNFPQGWAEWNGKYRDTLRRFLKGEASGREMRDKMAGSYALYGDDGRQAHQSINFLTAHDGLTLFDLVSFNVNSKAERDALNNRPWPHGPSDGGEEHNNSWDSWVPGATPAQTAALRRQRARFAMAMLMLSNGTPMVLGGDERLRTKQGNNNTYNLDNETNWLEWGPSRGQLNRFADRVQHLDGVEMPGETIAAFRRFTRRLIRFRRAHPAFHRAGWWSPEGDADGDGYPGVTFPQTDRDDAFGMRLDASRGDLGMTAEEWAGYPLRDRDLFVAVNGGPDEVAFALPAPSPGKRWVRVADSAAWAEAHGNWWGDAAGEEIAGEYRVHGRSLALFLER